MFFTLAGGRFIGHIYLYQSTLKGILMSDILIYIEPNSCPLLKRDAGFVSPISLKRKGFSQFYLMRERACMQVIPVYPQQR
jgi:hypothetical protein